MYNVYLYIYLILCYSFLCIQAVPGHICGDMDFKKNLPLWFKSRENSAFWKSCDRETINVISVFIFLWDSGDRVQGAPWHCHENFYFPTTFFQVTLKARMETP